LLLIRAIELELLFNRSEVSPVQGEGNQEGRLRLSLLIITRPQSNVNLNSKKQLDGNITITKLKT
jgi:hypothetical protein